MVNNSTVNAKKKHVMDIQLHIDRDIACNEDISSFFVMVNNSTVNARIRRNN